MRRPPHGTCAFVTCNQLGSVSQSANAMQMQFPRQVLRCKLTSSAQAHPQQDLQHIDFQTLVTHNHTIICASLGEGLTYSPRVFHALAYCHKKDCVCSEVVAGIITPRSFKFLFTARCPNLIGDFRDCFSLIYSKKFFCKSCDGFNRNRKLLHLDLIEIADTPKSKIENQVSINSAKQP